MSEPGKTNPRRFASATILSIVTVRVVSLIAFVVTPDCRAPWRACGNHKREGVRSLPPEIDSLIPDRVALCGVDRADHVHHGFDHHALGRQSPIDLRRRDADVTEHLLYITQFDAMFECV